jgi:hypothetical protein
MPLPLEKNVWKLRWIFLYLLIAICMSIPPLGFFFAKLFGFMEWRSYFNMEDCNSVSSWWLSYVKILVVALHPLFFLWAHQQLRLMERLENCCIYLGCLCPKSTDEVGKIRIKKDINLSSVYRMETYVVTETQL